MESLLLAFANQIPEVRLIWFVYRLHFGAGSFLVVARLAGSSRVFPSGLTAKALWQHVVKSSRGIIALGTAVLAHVLISQKDVAFAQSHGALGLLIFF
jgi:hypothetical protein